MALTLSTQWKEHGYGNDANQSLRYGEQVQLASAARQSHAAIILAAAGE
jgi:hypothetical protein